MFLQKPPNYNLPNKPGSSVSDNAAENPDVQHANLNQASPEK